MKLSLVIPFYNEADNLEDTYLAITRVLEEFYLKDYELIFVNDGSKDNSLEVLSKLINKDRRCRLISYSVNQGRGYALSKGFFKAKGEIIGYIDSDLEIDPKYIHQCVESLNGYDVAVVSKHLPKSEVETSATRKIASLVYNFWVRLILKSYVSDHQGGLKIFKKDVIKKTLPKVYSRGWLFDTEILYLCQRFGFKISEVPIRVTYGFGKIQTSMIADFLKSFIFVLKLRRNNIK